MKKLILFLAGIFCISNASYVFSNDIGVGVFLENDAVYLNEEPELEIQITAFNNKTSAQLVDVHIAIIDTNGTIYEYPDWNTNLEPWLSSFSVPAGFQLPVTFLGNLDEFPGELVPGAYKVVAAVTRPGTLDILSLNSSFFRVGGERDLYDVSGALTFNISKSATEEFTPIVSSLGSFSQIDNDVNINFAEVRRRTEQISQRIDTCIIPQGSFLKDDILGVEVLSRLDAGSSLTLSSPLAGNTTLNRSVFGADRISYDAENLLESFYQSGQIYTVTGTGGLDIDAFNVSAKAPEEIIVTEPNPSVSNSIDSSQDLQLLWEGNNGVGEIGFSMGRGNEVILCRFVDDGEAVIPSSLLVQLRNTETNNSDSNPIQDLIDLLGDNATQEQLDELNKQLEELNQLQSAVSLGAFRINFESLNIDNGIIDFSIVSGINIGSSLTIR